MNIEEYNRIIDQIIKWLLAGGQSATAILRIIRGFVESIKAAGGGGPTVLELAARIKVKVEERNEPALLAEIERLEKKLLAGIELAEIT